jgi:hypothetical protein
MFDEVHQRWRWLAHQKLDDAPAPKNASDPTGHDPQCNFFPYTVGYARSMTADLWGAWEYDFWQPAAGLNVALTNGSEYCLGKRERPKLFVWDNRTYLLNCAAPNYPRKGDTGTLTFIQEVLSMGDG